MSKEKTSDKGRNKPVKDGGIKFASVTSHLKSKDLQWLKEDMGFFDLPDNWDAACE